MNLDRLQVLEALKASHATGIVHRDIKPQNVIISETDSRAKLIDLGAAADLRVGINYVPNEYLLDPRYAPPQQYIMSTQVTTDHPTPYSSHWSNCSHVTCHHTPLQYVVVTQFECVCFTPPPSSSSHHLEMQVPTSKGKSYAGPSISP